MFQHSAPTLLAYSGTYAKNADMKYENILPFAFSFGIGGPKMEIRVKVLLELCIQVYMRLSLTQFMEGPTILVMNHIYNRQMSYKTGVMTCRSSINAFHWVKNCLHYQQKILRKSRTTTLTIWMQLQNVSYKQYQHHVKLWATLNKQQKMLDGAVLQCWIILG
jgi:hypothetical protein